MSDSQETRPRTVRQDGVTTAERYLKRLCDETFFSLWSYPGIYRDQGQTATSKEGKEVCDLLVVFKEHVLIFSDKDCKFPNTGNLALDWSRWFRRAVLNSAEQIWGAERWIRAHSDRIFLDRPCTRPFPIALPDMTKAKFHRIVVAHDGSRRCREHFGGSGSLLLAPRIIGSMHYADTELVQPFVIGQIDPARGFVHVFDDTTLEIVLKTMDTTADFVSYLTKKEAFIQSGRLGLATGEDDLLAFYLQRLNDRNEHDFVVPPNITSVYIDEGLWEEFVDSPQRQAQIDANKISYLWDDIIEKFNHHILAGTWYDQSKATVRDREEAVRFLAAECRTVRRLLAKSLLSMIKASIGDKRQFRRVMLPSSPTSPHYIFLLLPYPDFASSYEEYREVRTKLLEALCMVVRLQYPEARDVVGIATEAGDAEGRSEDVVYLDGRFWTEEMRAEAESLQRDLDLLTNTKGPFHYNEKEYPEVPRLHSIPAPPAQKRVVPGGRNAPCPCGSGKKYKKCCMRRESG